ncbi:MAG: hypothetical protein C4547_04265 [Phycisphaerales bacterium]|nr:MAG: hypothetical protein C4547_04265 [Phycisphaerales bacterium]
MVGALCVAVASAQSWALAAASLDADWTHAIGPAEFVLSPAADDSAFGVEPAPAYVRAGLPIAGPREIVSFADAAGSLLATPRDDGGEGVQRVYVSEIAYGVRNGRIVLVRLSGLMDDGRAVDVDNTLWPDVELIDGPADFVGRQILWGCGDTDRELLVRDVGYRIDENGELRLAHLRGVLEDGEEIEYEGPGPGVSMRDCDVQNVNECVSDPDEPCDWGVCQGIIDCGCVGFGSCVIRVKIKCVNNSCFDPKVCRYDRDAGLCDCVDTDKKCGSIRQEPTRGSVACSADGGRTVTENGHARVFKLEQPTRIGNVEYAVEACRDATGEGRPCQVYINVWHAPNFPQFEGSELLDSQQDLVPDGTQFQRRTVEMRGPIAPPGPMVIEVYNHKATDYFGFWPGSNPFGQESPSFLRAIECNRTNQWVDLAQIGFPNVHQILCFEAVRPGGPEGIPCEDVSKFKTKCSRKGKLKAITIFTDARHAGETILLAVNDIVHEVAIRGKKASFAQPGSVGNVTLELLRPFDCFEPREVLCGGDPDRECKYTTTAAPLVGDNCTACVPLPVGSVICRGACKSGGSSCPTGANKTVKTTCQTKADPNKDAYCTVQATGNGCQCILEP